MKIDRQFFWLMKLRHQPCSDRKLTLQQPWFLVSVWPCHTTTSALKRYPALSIPGRCSAILLYVRRRARSSRAIITALNWGTALKGTYRGTIIIRGPLDCTWKASAVSASSSSTALDSSRRLRVADIGPKAGLRPLALISLSKSTIDSQAW